MEQPKTLIRFFIRKLSTEFTDIRFYSASLAFATLLSLIPFLIVLLTFFQSVGVLDSLYPKIESLIFEFMKEATGATVTRYVRNTIGNAQFKTIGITGMLFFILSSLNLLNSLYIAFHKIWNIKIKKSYWQRHSIYWVILASTPLLILTLAVFRHLDFSFLISSFVKKQFLFFVYGSAILWLLYTYIPEVKVNRICSLSAAALASLCLSVLQTSFLWLSVKIFKHNSIYGSLATLPIFLLWLLLIWYIILGGVSFCAFLQQKIFKRSY